MKLKLHHSAWAACLALTIALATPRCATAAEAESSAEPEVHAAEPAVHQTEPADTKEDEGDQEAAAPGHPAHDSAPRVTVGSDVTLAAGEKAEDVVVVFGNAVLDGDVAGDVVVVWGKATVNGRVEGNLVAPFTAVTLGPKAHISGDLVAVGGTMERDPGAVVDGQKIQMTWDELEAKMPGLGVLKSMVAGAGDWMVKGPLLGRPLPHQWGWWWWLVFGAAGLYALCGLVLQRPITASVGVLREEPVMSFVAGILGYVGTCMLLFILLLTGLGLLIIPFVLIAAFAAQILGRVTLCQALGEQVGHQAGFAPLRRPLPALITGFSFLTAMMVVPLLGFLVASLTAPLGFGAVLLASFRSMRRDREVPSNPLPIPATPTPAAAPVVVAPLGTAAPPVLGSRPVTTAAETDLLTQARAGFWLRLAATLLDLIVVIVVAALVRSVDYFLVFWFAYHVGMWTWRGTTVGGVILSLKIVRRDGQPLGFLVALVRSLASVLSLVTLGIGFFWAGWSSEKTAWHDLVAGTCIVRVPRGTALL